MTKCECGGIIANVGDAYTQQHIPCSNVHMVITTPKAVVTYERKCINCGRPAPKEEPCEA